MNSNLFKFIKKNKTPFITIQTRLQACENGEEKKKYKGLIKNYNELSYEESINHYNKVEHKYNYNQILFKVPKNIIIIDTDTEKAYKYIVKVLKQYNIYNENNIFKSFSGLNNDLYYKRHFIFKYETDNEGFKKQLQGLDIFNNIWGVAEWFDSDINYNDLQTIDYEIIENIIKHCEKKASKKSSKQSNTTDTTDPTTTETDPEIITEPKPEIINKILGCLKCLSYDRFNYNDWLRIGMIIKNETNNINIWKDWSKSYKKYNEKEINDKWETFKNEGNKLKIGSLINYAKEDNEDLYNELFNIKSINKLINKSTLFDNKLNTREIAKHFKIHFGNKWICQKGKLYYYNGVYWKSEDIIGKMPIINNFISEDYFNKLLEEFNIYEKEQLNESKDKDATISYLKFVRDYIYSILNHNSRQKFIGELLCILNNDDIIFNNEPYLFSFNNKVFDLKQGKFIEPKPEYYISLTCGYNFIERNEEDNKKELHKLLNTIFPEEELKKLYLTILSTGLDGIPLEKFILANGTGGNGKGLLNELLQHTLGDYSYVLPSEILLKPLKTGNNPEVANMNNKRLVIAREPDKKLLFNCATIKEITGGTELNARLNYSNDTKTILNLSFILECNDKPKLNEVNDALSRRILDIPFKNKFVDKDIYDELDEQDKKTTFLINKYYKTNEFKNNYKQTLFLILTEYYKEYFNNGSNLPITNEVRERNKAYLKSSDELLNWFEDHYEKTDNKKDTIKLKRIYEMFKVSNYFNNLNKIQKRQNNYKHFIEKLESNIFLKKFITVDNHNNNIITNHIFKTSETLEDNDNDNEFIEGNPLDM